jgi:hypothetical protein
MEPDVAAWIKADHDFPCFLPSTYVSEFFERQAFRLRDTFISKYDVGFSEYLVFKKEGPAALLYHCRSLSATHQGVDQDRFNSIGHRPTRQ